MSDGVDISGSVVKIFGAKATNALIAFVGIAFFARELGASQLGVFFLFEVTVGILGMIADFGLQGSTEKRISEGEDPAGILGTALLLKTVFLLPIIVLVVAFAGPLNAYIGAEVTSLLIAGVLAREFAHLMVRVLNGELRVGDTAALRLAQNVTWISIGTVLVLSGFDAVGVIYAFIAGFTVMFIWANYRRETGIGQPSIEHARSLLSYSRYNFVSVIGEYVYNWIDLAIIGLLLTQTEVGVYEVAWRITQVVTLISTSIGMTIFPQISAWSAENTIERIEGLIEEAITSSLLLVIPAFVGVLLLAEEILGILFGPEYTVAATALIVLMGHRILYAAYVILWRALKGIDRPDLVARATLVAIASNVVLNVLLVYEFGIVGAAVGTAIAATANTALNFHYLTEFVTLRLDIREIGWSVLSAIGMGIVLLLLIRTVSIQTILKLVGAVSLGVVVYGAFILVYQPLRVKVIYQARQLFVRLTDVDEI